MKPICVSKSPIWLPFCSSRGLGRAPFRIHTVSLRPSRSYFARIVGTSRAGSGAEEKTSEMSFPLSMHFVCVVGRPGGKTNDFPLSQHFECVDGSPGNNSGDIALSQHLARVVGSPGEKIREFALFQKAKAKVHPSIHPSICLLFVLQKQGSGRHHHRFRLPHEKTMPNDGIRGQKEPPSTISAQPLQDAGSG